MLKSNGMLIRNYEMQSGNSNKYKYKEKRLDIFQAFFYALNDTSMFTTILLLFFIATKRNLQ